MKLKPFFLLAALAAACPAFAQQEPDVNAFYAYDQEAKALNINDVRKEIGYPQAAIDSNMTGAVLLRILVSEQGEYVKHKVLRSPGATLSRAVAAQLPKLRFTPSMQEGKAVASWVNIPFSFQLEDPSEAVIRSLSESISANPGDYVSLVKRGLQYQQTGNFEKAISDFDLSLSHNPRKNKKKLQDYPYLFFAQVGKGKALLAQEKWEEALREFDAAIATEALSKNRDTLMLATLPTAYAERGAAHAALKHFEQAYADYDYALQHSPEQACTVYSLKYEAAQAQKDYTTVVNCLSALIACDSSGGQSLSLHYNRGFYRIEAGDHAGALEDFDNVLARSPHYLLRMAALCQRSRSLLAMKRYEEAEAEVRKAMNLNVLHPLPYYYLTQVQFAKGDTEQACKSLQRALSFGLEGEELSAATALQQQHCPE